MEIRIEARPPLHIEECAKQARQTAKVWKQAVRVKFNGVWLTCHPHTELEQILADYEFLSGRISETNENCRMEELRGVPEREERFTEGL